MQRLNVVGLGYIGLPTSLMFAANGISVTGTDLNEELVLSLRQNMLTFEEDGLLDIFERALKNDIRFSTELEKTDMYIVAVPTPYIKETKRIEPKYVVRAVEDILDVCEKGAVIIIESTISPGTIDRFIRPVIQERGFITGKDIHLCHAPERIIPGRMVYELEHNSRTLGVDSIEIGETVKSLYESFCKEQIIITDIKTAEMSKVVENTFRDVNIALANELAKICEVEKIDIYELIKIANMHPRVNILQPGPGVGGHCISVDPWFLVGDHRELVNIILSARQVNDSMPSFVIKKIHKIMKENNISGLDEIGLYGITYKENVNDLRESPTLQMLNKLEQYFVTNIKVFDPMITENKIKGQMQNFEEFLESIKLVVIMVAHDHLINNMEVLQDKIVFDTRNVITIGKKIYKL